jgi:hypothetical protein
MKTPFVGLLSFLLLLVPAGASPAAEPPFRGGKWIDLSHDFSSETLYWPTAQNFVLETEFQGKTAKGYFYEANRYRASEHGGTHIDAPVHFAEGLFLMDAGGLAELVRAVMTRHLVSYNGRPRLVPAMKPRLPTWLHGM